MNAGDVVELLTEFCILFFCSCYKHETPTESFRTTHSFYATYGLVEKHTPYQSR